MSKITFRTAATALAILAAPAAFIIPLQSGAATREEVTVIPDPAADAPLAAEHGSSKAVLAGGCFWGVQAVFQHVKGVTHVTSGYSGGNAMTAQYETVSTGTTGHAESVEITYDPAVVSYGKLLKVYFEVAHNPTELNRQGPDEGSSYRSEIFAATPAQEQTARAYIAQLNGAHLFAGPVVTKVEALKGFYKAEDYHQDYLFLNPTAPYIVYNDLPKIAALKSVWPQYYRPDPVLLSSAHAASQRG
jgi:peptide-methionine (S)-S-oxide reductase